MSEPKITEVPEHIGAAFALIEEWCKTVGIYSIGTRWLGSHGPGGHGERWTLQSAAPNHGEWFGHLGHCYTLHCGGAVLIHGPASEDVAARLDEERRVRRLADALATMTPAERAALVGERSAP